MKFQIPLLLILIVVACSPLPVATGGPDQAVTDPPGDNSPTEEPVRNPFSPQAEDEDLTRGNVYLGEASVVIRESFPPQISLSVSGDLPTPCNQLRAEIGAPDQDNKIEVELYSVINPEKACVQVLEPFEETIELGTFPAGHYTVWVNGEMIGEFDA
jgi:hypothetical protein